MAHLGTVAQWVLLASAVVAGWPAPAEACSPGACQVGRLVPQAGATIPRNAPALAWRPPRELDAPGGAPRPTLTVSRVDGTSPVVVDHDEEDSADGWVWIRVSQLEVGGRYRIEVDGECAPEPVEFEVGPEAPFPEALGTVTTPGPARTDVTVATISGSCTTELPAMTLPVSVALDGATEPWADLLLYRTMVDGAPWTPSWSLGPVEPYAFARGDDLVFTECAPEPGRTLDAGAQHDGVDPGEHEIRIDATLPGRVGAVESTPLVTHLDCRAARGDDGCSVAGDSALAGRAAQGVRAWVILLGSLLGLIWMWRRREWLGRLG